MAANRKPKPAKRPKANNGQRKAKPISDNQAGPGPVGAPSSGRTISVRSRGERRNRAGLSFNTYTSAIVRECEIGTDRFEAILADRMLRCELQQ